MLLGVGGTIAATALLTSGEQVIARGELTSRSTDAASAHGTVVLVDTGHGLQLQLSVAGMPTPGGYYAVWLYDGNLTMINVGTLGSTPLNIPAVAQNIEIYNIVDVSSQQLGQQEHGKSMLQGRLHRVTASG